MEHLQPTPEQPAERGEAADERLDAIDALYAGLSEYFTDERFGEYLAFMSRFHNYSAHNIGKILSQRPDASMVMGYGNRAGTSGWKSVGRQVREGERGISIWAPQLKWITDPSDPDDRIQVLTGYKDVKVFDVSQTDGDPIPLPPRVEELSGNSEAAVLLGGYLKDYAATEGVPVMQKDFEDRRRGSYDVQKKAIFYRTGMSADQTTKTIAHEMAHHLVMTRPWGEKTVLREDHEVVAEGAAFVTLNHFGIDTAEYSFGYIGQWAQDMDRVRDNLNAINRTARAMIEGVESSGPSTQGTQTT